LKNDTNYQLEFEKREQERKREWAMLEAEYSEFAKDCFDTGYCLKTAWDLIEIADPYPALIPVLIKHLHKENHSAKFREGIARALAVYDSASYFNEIFSIYSETRNEPETVRWAIASALSVAAREKQDFDIIEKLIFDKNIGNDRSALLYAVKHMSGEQRKRVLAFAKSEPELKINLRVHNLK
jgi:hypothetical protein